MRHIHPFPARMAPEIALSKIRTLAEGQTVLDPMCGSGMVLGQAARNGLYSFGYDLDPLARLISRVGATKIDEKKSNAALTILIDVCSKKLARRSSPRLPWIDNDEETLSFVRYWFDRKQVDQLRLLSNNLIVNPICSNSKILDILKIAVSRLIITKEPKASLARDTAHSRPHRTITANDYDILSELPASLNHVLKALQATSIKVNAKTYLGDARNMTRIKNESVDAIITSPPYLNAIDYMRGHRLSLIWWGYSLKKLRCIRSRTIGAERSLDSEASAIFVEVAERLKIDQLENKKYRMLWRYFVDLTQQTKESARVLKPNASAMYVIGNSMLRGQHVQNSELLKEAAALAGLETVSETAREIPNNRRYLPVTVKSSNPLASRMRTEHIIEFVKR